MKVALLCLLALVAVVIGSDVSSYDKVDLGAALLSRMTAQALHSEFRTQQDFLRAPDILSMLNTRRLTKCNHSLTVHCLPISVFF
ncbi:hypothetical protein FHG87_020113 [Trinorchestia longiramus]|nr:hypothetical protein FHG87_020113 [Trinorchestia longiramus]